MEKRKRQITHQNTNVLKYLPELRNFLEPEAEEE